MTSKWVQYKEEILALRATGMSMTTIERKYGVPRSTLSYWFRHVILTEDQKARLKQNSKDGWAKARVKAVESHRANKALRLITAQKYAQSTIDKLPLTNELLDLALAMLYLGEGSKSGPTSLASSDPKILNFYLAVLKNNYNVDVAKIRCDLHLRMDQDEAKLKTFWSQQLNLPLFCFRYAAYDKRSEGKPTYERYNGVCVVSVHDISIRRKLEYIYSQFCVKVSQLNKGA